MNHLTISVLLTSTPVVCLFCPPRWCEFNVGVVWGGLVFLQLFFLFPLAGPCLPFIGAKWVGVVLVGDFPVFFVFFGLGFLTTVAETFLVSSFPSRFFFPTKGGRLCLFFFLNNGGFLWFFLVFLLEPVPPPGAFFLGFGFLPPCCFSLFLWVCYFPPFFFFWVVLVGAFPFVGGHRTFHFLVFTLLVFLLNKKGFRPASLAL